MARLSLLVLGCALVVMLLYTASSDAYGNGYSKSENGSYGGGDYGNSTEEYTSTSTELPTSAKIYRGYYSKQKCGKNAALEKKSKSSQKCAETCGNLGNVPECSGKAKPGCDCKKGFVFKQGMEGDCVKRDACPSKNK